MADYSNAEMLNELARVFKARVSPVREGGTLNTKDEYTQLIELGSITMLLNNDAIFYVAQLADNRLYSLLRQEIDLVEDILVGLDDLGQTGTPVVDTGSLSNAKTAVLALDAATTMTGRPEATTFQNQMSTFTSQLHPNVVSPDRGILVHPKESAGSYIKTDLERLKSVHANILTAQVNLRDLLDSYLELNIPSKVSTNSLAGVRQSLDDMIDQIETMSRSDNVAYSRTMLLKSLVGQVAVSIIAGFTDPREVKYRSPLNPIPSTMTQLGRAAGSGAPASLLTQSGPWTFPLSGPLKLKIDGGSELTINLDKYAGSILNGRASEVFNLPTTNRYLHVIVDPSSYNPVAVSAVATQITIPRTRLGFKHLGSFFVLSGGGMNFSTNPSDKYPRVLVDLPNIQTFTGASFDLPTSIVTVGFPTSFVYNHVGGYIRNSSGQRFEIVEFISSSQVRISNYTGLAVPFPGGTAYLHAVVPSGGDITLDFTPALIGFAGATGATVTFGPATKTVQLPSGPDITLAQVLNAVQTEAGADVNNPYSALNRHVAVMASSLNSSRLGLGVRSRLFPALQISGSYVQPGLPAAGPPTVIAQSAHELLGFSLGDHLNPQFDMNDYLSPEELVGAINTVIGASGIAKVVNQEVTSGLLDIPPSNFMFYDHQQRDLAALGVLVGDVVEITKGFAAGTYPISTVSGYLAVVRRSTQFSVAEIGLPYRILRNAVRVSSSAEGLGSSIEATSSPTALGLPSGVQYGLAYGFEAVDKFGSPFSFRDVAGGDLLRLLGDSTTYSISEANDTSLVLPGGIPSNIKDVGFEILSWASLQYTNFHGRLSSFISSSSLLKMNKFDVNLDALDYALTLALLPGQNFEASRNQAKRVTAELLSILTDAPRRSSEYTTSIPIASDNLESILSSYSVSAVRPLDSYLNLLVERKYNRAADLLTGADVTAFFGTDEETGSYAGAVLSASRTVLQDLPRYPTMQSAAEQERDYATSVTQSTDSNDDFSDTDGSLDNEE